MAGNDDVEKAWASIRSQAALLGLATFRSDARDGAVRYFSLLGSGEARLHPDLAGLRARLKEMRGGGNGG
jgi:hypothetical protein